MATEQELRLKATTEGFDQAAGQVGKVTDAVKKTGDANTTSAESYRDLIGVLRTIHPALGQLADGFGKAIGLAGDLATADVKLGSVLNSTTEFLKKNASALLLVGVGGAVVFGINAVIGAIQRMDEESRKATEELKRQRQALDEIFRARADRRQEIENISDVRRGGGLTAEASARAAGAAESVSHQFTQLDPTAVNRAAGLFGDSGLDTEQLAQAAFLIQTNRLKPNEGASSASLVRQFNRSAKRFQPRIAEFFSRETAQGQGTGTGGASLTASSASAIGAVRSNEPGTVSIEDFIKNLPGSVAEGIDPKRLASIVKGVLAIQGETLPFSATPQHAANGIAEATKPQSHGATEGKRRNVKTSKRQNVETSKRRNGLWPPADETPPYHRSTNSPVNTGCRRTQTGPMSVPRTGVQDATMPDSETKEDA